MTSGYFLVKLFMLKLMFMNEEFAWVIVGNLKLRSNQRCLPFEGARFSKIAFQICLRLLSVLKRARFLVNFIVRSLILVICFLIIDCP
jgi:hypothetical protein